MLEVCLWLAEGGIELPREKLLLVFTYDAPSSPFGLDDVVWQLLKAMNRAA